LSSVLLTVVRKENSQHYTTLGTLSNISEKKKRTEYNQLLKPKIKFYVNSMGRFSVAEFSVISTH
jgi:hypothetical protein